MDKYIKWDMRGNAPIRIGEVEFDKALPYFDGDKQPRAGFTVAAQDFQDDDGKWFRIWRGKREDGSLMPFGYQDIK